jgi:hypothetical protein
MGKETKFPSPSAIKVLISVCGFLNSTCCRLSNIYSLEYCRVHCSAILTICSILKFFFLKFFFLKYFFLKCFFLKCFCVRYCGFWMYYVLTCSCVMSSDALKFCVWMFFCVWCHDFGLDHGTESPRNHLVLPHLQHFEYLQLNILSLYFSTSFNHEKGARKPFDKFVHKTHSSSINLRIHRSIGLGKSLLKEKMVSKWDLYPISFIRIKEGGI